LKTAGFRLNQ